MDLEVARGDFARVRRVDRPPAPLAGGQARIRIDRFGLSSNNVTYAVVGDMLGYWQFFPASPAAADDDVVWGRVPVWGFGEVVESQADDLGVGERLFGYFPISSELVISVGRAAERTVADVSPHRAEMASAYNSYQRCAADPLYRADREDLQMLLFPLFYTSFVMDDFLVDHADFGAGAVVISSASAKTSIGEAFLAHGRGQRVVGLTSAPNTEFVASLGVYDQVLPYERIDQLEQLPSVYVDVSGNQDVTRAVHTRLEGVLAHSMVVGDTHWDHEASATTEALAGPSPRFLFAPTQIAKRTADWGPDVLHAKVAAAWDRFCEWVPGWLSMQQVRGPDALTALWSRFLEGQVDPKAGYTASLSADQEAT